MAVLNDRPTQSLVVPCNNVLQLRAMKFTSGEIIVVTEAGFPATVMVVEGYAANGTARGWGEGHRGALHGGPARPEG